MYTVAEEAIWNISGIQIIRAHLLYSTFLHLSLKQWNCTWTPVSIVTIYIRKCGLQFLAKNYILKENLVTLLIIVP